MTDKDDRRQADREAHAIAIGKIAMGWNEFHSILHELFAGLFGVRSYALAYNAWSAIPSDKSQRDMLRAVAQSKLRPGSRELKDLLWLLEKTNEIVSGQRNIGIHTTLWSLIELDGTHKFIPVATNARTAQALAGADILKEYAHYEKQIRKMLMFAVGLQFALSPRRKGKRHWPERPVLSKRSS